MYFDIGSLLGLITGLMLILSVFFDRFQTFWKSFELTESMIDDIHELDKVLLKTKDKDEYTRALLLKVSIQMFYTLIVCIIACIIAFLIFILWPIFIISILILIKQIKQIIQNKKQTTKQ